MYEVSAKAYGIPMKVRPLDLTSLPPVSGLHAADIRSAAAQLGTFDRTSTVNVAPFGTVSLRCSAVVAPTPPEETDAVWALCRDDGDARLGFLVVTALGSLRIVAMTLGLPAPLAPRPLGRLERGIVTATITRVLRATAADVTVVLSPRPWQPEGLVRLKMAAHLGPLKEKIGLDVPVEWIPPDGGAGFLRQAAGRNLCASFSVVLAQTTLTSTDWSGVRPGDAVVFDDSPMPGNDDAWTVAVNCGQFSARAHLTVYGRLTLLTRFRDNPVPAARRAAPVPRSIMHPTDHQQPSSSLAVLASAPIEIVAEVGRLVLRADEVAALGPGSILSLGPLRPTTVDLLVGDATWARGELVDVDGQLGVRVTAVVRGREPLFTSDDAETAR